MKKNKALLLTIVAIATVIILFTVIYPWKVTRNQFRNYYISELEKHKDQILDYYNKTGINNIAIINIEDSDIPELIYLTYEEDEYEKDIKEVYINYAGSYNFSASSSCKSLGSIIDKPEDAFTLFHDGDNRYYYEFYGNYKTEISLNPATGVRHTLYRCYVDEKNSHEDGGLILDEYKAESGVTIILSTLPDDELHKAFPIINDNIAMNYNDAIKYLQENDL